jgi:hypothetical protein
MQAGENGRSIVRFGFWFAIKRSVVSRHDSIFLSHEGAGLESFVRMTLRKIVDAEPYWHRLPQPTALVLGHRLLFSKQGSGLIHQAGTLWV